MTLEINVFIHLIGFGLLFTTLIAGSMLEIQFRKAKDVSTQATILKTLRPIGILSPIAMLIMLVSGIGNMQLIGVGILSLGWLTAKIIFFAIIVISGILFAIQLRKRSTLVQKLATGGAPANASELLRKHNRQVTLAYVVMTILVLLIVYLAVIGTSGAQ